MLKLVPKSKKINRKITKLRGGSGFLSLFKKKKTSTEVPEISTSPVGVGEVRVNPLYMKYESGVGESETKDAVPQQSSKLFFRPTNLQGYYGESQKKDLITNIQINAIKKLYNFLKTITTYSRISLSTAHTKIILLYMYLYNIYVKDKNSLDEDEDKNKIHIENLINTKLNDNIYGNKELMKDAFCIFINFINSIDNIDNKELKDIIKNNKNVIINLNKFLTNIDKYFISYYDPLFESLSLDGYGKKEIHLLLSDKYDESKFTSFANKIKNIYDVHSNLNPNVNLKDLDNPFEYNTTV